MSRECLGAEVETQSIRQDVVVFSLRGDKFGAGVIDSFQTGRLDECQGDSDSLDNAFCRTTLNLECVSKFYVRFRASQGVQAVAKQNPHYVPRIGCRCRLCGAIVKVDRHGEMHDSVSLVEFEAVYRWHRRCHQTRKGNGYSGFLRIGWRGCRCDGANIVVVYRRRRISARLSRRVVSQKSQCAEKGFQRKVRTRSAELKFEEPYGDIEFRRQFGCVIARQQYLLSSNQHLENIEFAR
jgi:hypothetical protein